MIPVGPSLPDRSNRVLWLRASLSLFMLIPLFYDGTARMVHQWSSNETYSHGFFVPVICLYLIWERRERLQKMHLRGSWWGFAVVFGGLGLFFVGEFATLYVVINLSLLVVLVGLTLAAIGGRGVREIAFPLFYLFVMIPLPNFLYQGLSAWLQMISSKLGVGCLQFVGVTAFREGNVIDLGPIQLQVVEACSGLRYLFPLAALALICAYLFKDKMWKRVLLFLSSFPISVFLNGFRIGITGILVDLYGKGPAEGFFHSFSGWILFVSSLILLMGEMLILGRIEKNGRWRSLGELFGQINRGKPNQSGHEMPERKAFQSNTPGPAYLFSIALLVPALIGSSQIGSRLEHPPEHRRFLDFPLQVDDWKGRPITMEQQFIDALRFDDYLLVDYHRPDGSLVNLYSAYYRSQRKGQSVHSPRTCIPGGGWKITSIEEREIHSRGTATPLRVNRVLIEKDELKQVVLYWFAGRGRNITNEYLVKFYLLWDAITKNRTDGSLVRLTSPVMPGEDESIAEARLIVFTQKIDPLLKQYIPD